MKVLLDSHTFFWWTTDSPKLSRTARGLIDEDSTDVLISSVVAWEISSKVRSGKWREAEPLADAFFATIKHYGFLPLSLTLEHAHRAGTFTVAHRDPFDRMLAAQSLIESASLITIDPVFSEFGIEIVW